MLSYRQIFSHLPTLETQRLILRKMRMRDRHDLFAYASDPEVSRHVLWDTHETLRDSDAFLRGAIRQYRKGLPASFAIVLKETGRMVGTIGFMWVNPEYRSAEVGYSLARDCWNQGLMTEALARVIAFGFDTLRLNRIEAQHEITNPASGHVMAHVGMRKEGVLRQRVRNKGVYSDVALYAILRSDPKNIRTQPK